MKNQFLLFLLFLSMATNAAEEKKTVKSDIKNVTVFLNRAQLFSTTQTAIKSGVTEIVIEQLPATIDPQSIQVSGKGKFTIMSVKHSLDYLDVNKHNKEVQMYQDSIEFYENKIEILKNEKDVLAKEEQFLLANQSIKGNDAGINSAELIKVAEFFRKRMSEIRMGIINTDRAIKKNNEKLQGFRNNLAQLNKKKNQPTSKITVAVSADAPTQAILDFNYIITNAGWSPIYDLRAKDSQSPVQLGFKAIVYQNTGFDWDNVKLTLSTANPSLSGQKPHLPSTYLNFYVPVTRSVGGSAKKKLAAPSMAYSMDVDMGNEVMEEGIDALKLESKTISDFTSVVQTTLNSEYAVAIPYTVPSGGNGQLVDIKKYDLPAEYKYSAVPKMDKDAFLMALVAGWEDLSLVSGTANIYFEGTYIGETYLDLNSTRDTIDISLGRDSKIVIERKNLKDYSSKKLIGANKKEEYAYEISVRNTKKEPVSITLEDQIPVSRNSQIEVEVIDAGGATIDVATGKLTWKMDLQGQETKKVVFKYSVKYPKGKVITETN
ncbi:MAG TPA: DUF4139 domain-containing protein [Cytophagaceae bacterium]